MGGPVGLLPPPKKKQTVLESFPSYGSNHSQMPREGILSFFVGLVHARANEHRPQQQETMTNRVRHLTTSARKRNECGSGRGFLSPALLIRGAQDVRGVHAFRTTTRMVVLGGIPLLNIRVRGPGLSYQKGCKKITRPLFSFDVPG